MNIQHYEKGLHYSDRQLLHIARKLGKMATYCKKIKDESSSIRVDSELRKTEKKRDALKVVVTITLPKKTLRAESRRPDVIEAIDRCVTKLQPQLKKYKALHQQRGRVQKALKHLNKKK